MKQLAPQDVLDLRMPEGNDAGASTVRYYLIAIVEAVWSDGECFSGKRPFGNSNWRWDVYSVLLDADLIDGTRDEGGGVEDVDVFAAERIVRAAIQALGDPRIVTMR